MTPGATGRPVLPCPRSGSFPSDAPPTRSNRPTQPRLSANPARYGNPAWDLRWRPTRKSASGVAAPKRNAEACAGLGGRRAVTVDPPRRPTGRVRGPSGAHPASRMQVREISSKATEHEMLHFLGSELDLEVDEVWERYDGPRLFAGHEVSGRDSPHALRPNGLCPSVASVLECVRGGRAEVARLATFSHGTVLVRWRPPPLSPTGCCCAPSATTTYSLRPAGACRLVVSNPPRRSHRRPHH